MGVKDYKDVPYRLLEPVPELSYGDSGSGNLIVQGENLLEIESDIKLFLINFSPTLQDGDFRFEVFYSHEPSGSIDRGWQTCLT